MKCCLERGGGERHLLLCLGIPGPVACWLPQFKADSRSTRRQQAAIRLKPLREVQANRNADKIDLLLSHVCLYIAALLPLDPDLWCAGRAPVVMIELVIE